MSKKQIVDEIHRSARKNFPRRKYLMVGINDTFQADLIEMIPFAEQNKEYRYILMVIDVFSKRAWARGLKNKTGQEVTRAMASIFDENPNNIPRNLHTDDGKEFFNQNFQRLLKKHKINHYSTYTKMKASIVERLNRTILNKLFRHFNLIGSHEWVSHVQRIIHNYNSTVHRTIKMRPIDGKKKISRICCILFTNTIIASISAEKINLMSTIMYASASTKRCSRKATHQIGLQRFFA